MRFHFIVIFLFITCICVAYIIYKSTQYEKRMMIAMKDIENGSIPKYTSKELWEHEDVQLWLNKYNYLSQHERTCVTGPDLEVIKTRMLEQLEWFHLLSIKYNFVYSLAGGNLIGLEVCKNVPSATEQFLPQDDDVDVIISQSFGTFLEKIWTNEAAPLTTKETGTRYSLSWFKFRKLPSKYNHKGQTMWIGKFVIPTRIRNYFMAWRNLLQNKEMKNVHALEDCFKKQRDYTWFKIVFANQRTFSLNPGGLDIFGIYMNLTDGKPAREPTKKNTYISTYCGKVVRVYNHKYAEEYLDREYSPVWRKKILL